LFIAGIKGSCELPEFVHRLGIHLRRMTIYRVTLIGIIASTVLMFMIFNPIFFVPREPYAPIYGWEAGASLEGLRAAEKVISAESCLTTSNNIAAHYGQRTDIYVFGIGNWSSCDFSLVDLVDTRFVSFGSPQQIVCDQFLTQDYRPIFYRDNVVILKRDAAVNPEYVAQLADFCKTLMPS
jgi:uncharacterized membrane protein